MNMPSPPKTTQATASVVRQVLAVLAALFGVLTAAVPALQLPSVVSAVLLGAGAAILTVEHYLSDPSTGNPPSP